MCAVFNELSAIEDQDAIRIPQCRKSVRDGGRGSSANENFKGFLDAPLRFGVDVAGCLIENQNLWVIEQTSSNRETLFFAA